MNRTIDGKIRQADTLDRRLNRLPRTGETAPLIPLKQAGSDSQEDTRMEMLQELEQLILLNEASKVREKAGLNNMLDHLPARMGGRWEEIHTIKASLGWTPYKSDFDNATQTLSILVAAQEPWIQNIRRIRSICGQLNIPPSHWPVSQVGAVGSKQNEPDIDAIIRWYEQILDNHPNRGWITNGYATVINVLKNRKKY